MGYHGFGMRKEVYQRKPKKAFKKVKKHIAKNPYNAPQKRADREVYIHTYHKPAYKRWWFIVLAIAAIFFIRYAYLSTWVWPAERLEQQVIEFENGGIVEYYHTHKPTFDSIMSFMADTDGTLNEIGRNLYFSQAEITINSRSIGDGRRHHYFRSNDEEHIRYRVENDVLKYERFDIGERQSEDWTLEFDLDNIKEIDQSFLTHLGVERHALDHYLRICFKNRWKISEYSDGTFWYFRQHDEHYEIFFLREGKELSSRQKREMKELVPGVFWQ